MPKTSSAKGRTQFVNSPCARTTEYVEGPTKTKQAGLRKVNRRITQRMFATSDSRCPVKYLERLISKRPQPHRNPAHFTFSPSPSPSLTDIWYFIQPMGINKIDSFLKKITTVGGLDITKKHFTNHSVWNTTVRNLQKAGVSNDKIIAITGHKIEQSIKAYVDTDLDSHISALLSKQRPLVEKPISANAQLWHVPRSLAPQFGFYNCGVYFGSTCSSSQTSTQVSEMGAVQPSKKRRIIIDSDSEED